MNEGISQFAEIETLPPEVAGKILTRFNVFIYEIIPLTLIGGGLVLTLGGGSLLSVISDSTETSSHWLKIFAIASVPSGILLGVIFFFFDRTNPYFISNHRIHRIARQQINHRKDKMVDPASADSRLVEIVPRSNWERPTLRNAEEIGFLKVDRENGLLLFEGDRSRYRIPAQAIVEAKQEYALHYDQESSGNRYNSNPTYIERRYFFVVLALKLEQQTYEAAFRILVGKGLFTMDQQGYANLDLLKEIHQLQQNSASNATL